MVHRSVIGSLERAVAHLIERYGGAFPPWLAPTQVALLPVSPSEMSHAASVLDRCARLGLRARLDTEGTLAARVRANRLVPYQAVLGPRESAGDELSLRLRDGRRLEPLPTAEGLGRIRAAAEAHTADLWPDDAHA